MSDRHDSDDERFEEPPTTFIGILEKSLEGFEGVLDEIREGIEDADEDHPLPPGPFERIRGRLEDAEGDAVVIDVEKELETIRDAVNPVKSDQPVQRDFDMSREEPYYQGGEPPYAEARGGPLLKALGDGPRARILATFIGKHYTELSTDDVETLTGIDRSKILDHLHDMEDLGLLEAERADGGPPRWTFNTDHPVARKLGQLDDVCGREWLGSDE